MKRVLLSVALLLFATACSSTGTLPPGTGRGLIAFDSTPPAGVTTWQRPTVQQGDTFTLLRGGQLKQKYVVTEVTAAGHTLQDAAGHRLKRDADLGNLGEWPPEGDEPVHALTPVDARFHWPLWVGKKWRCEFADRSKDKGMLLEVAYVVEALDTLVVPAGTFSALRIVRTSRLIVDGETYLDRTIVQWYAPEIGLDVRQLIDGTMFELAEFTRAPQR